MIYGNRFLNEALIADAEKRKIFDGTRKAINNLFKENNIKAKVSVKYYDKYLIINRKFLSGSGSEYVYMITVNNLDLIADGKGPIIRWINSNKSSIKKEIEKETGFKVSKIEVIDGTVLAQGVINISIKYDLGY